MDSAVIKSPVRFTRTGWILITLAAILYGVLLATHVGAYAGGSDSSGYLNHARLLAEGRVHVVPRTIPQLKLSEATPWIYSALGFKPAADGSIVPTYPTGLPVLVLIAAKIVGWAQAGNVVLWLHGMLGAILTYLAGRTFGLSCRLALIATVIVAGSPVYLFIALQAMSDVPALVWSTAAVLAAWWGREKLGWACAGGAAYAMAVLIRPTDALVLAPIAITLGLGWKRWLAWIAGGVPGGIFFCLHSHAAYGKFLTTGYGDSAGLASVWIAPTLLHYAHWLPLLFTPVVIAFLGLPLLARKAPREVAVLLAWVLVFAGFYSAYDCTHQTWWYLRFLLPAAPALAIGGLLVIRQAAQSRLSPRVATVATCLALVVIAGWLAQWNKKLGALHTGEGERVYLVVADWLNEHLPPNAVVAAMQHSGALYYYTRFTFIRWDELEDKSFHQVAVATEADRMPLYAVLSPFEIDEQGAFSTHMPEGSWKKIHTIRDTTIWQWSPPAVASK